MDDQKNEGYHPIEPTTPVTLYQKESEIAIPSPYLPTGYLDHPYNIAPPPPKKTHSQHFFVVALLGASIMFFGASLFFYLAGTHQETVARVAPTTAVPTVTPTVQPYTAQDILNEMIAHNLTVGSPAYGVNLASLFTYAPYNNVAQVPFQSSAVWNVDPFHTEDCNYCTGLWVYSSYDIAVSVQQQLLAAGAIVKQTPPQGPAANPDGMMIRYGRCVAYGVQDTLYATIIKQFCV